MKFLILLLLIVSCSDRRYRLDNREEVLSSSEKYQGSTTSGNFVATAIKEVNQLDIVLYPSEFLEDNQYSMLRGQLGTSEANAIVDKYPGGAWDSFLLGRMKGSSIKKFIRSRVRKLKHADLQVAGMSYSINMIGGVITNATFSEKRDFPMEDDKVYKVAISEYMYDFRQSFPGYYYGENLNYDFKSVDRKVSAKESVKTYLSTLNKLPYLAEKRARFNETVLGDLGYKKIYEIQGAQHRSPLYGHRVQAKGIITAFGKRDRRPKGYDIYIQEAKGDGDDRTSDAIHLFLSADSKTTGIAIGKEIEVEGVVHEDMTTTGLGRTSIRLEKYKVSEEPVELPDAVHIGKGGRTVPDRFVSTYRRGDLNFKPASEFNIKTDGIDFWESLEGMRISFNNPKIQGFRGGNEKFVDDRKGHLSLYMTIDRKEEIEKPTNIGGINIDPLAKDFNPEIVLMVSNHLSKNDIKPKETFFNVGETLPGLLEGVMTYDMNLFGGGEYSFVTPQIDKKDDNNSVNNYLKTNQVFSDPKTDEKICQRHYFQVFDDEQEDNFGELATFEDKMSDLLNPDKNKVKGMVPLCFRGQTRLAPEENALTIATFNVENLSAPQTEKIKKMGEVIAYSLKCPDIVNLVEIQDDNGEEFSGGSSSAQTLEMIIKHTERWCKNSDYRPVNIDPIDHNDGGVPGGNIRVSQIYNANRVGFNFKPAPDAMTDALVRPGEGLVYNPGRVYPTNDIFKHTRKSLVAQYTFRGENVYVIGNHFNSKLGDTSSWSSIQPVVFGSEEKRGKLAYLINKFVKEIYSTDPNANIVVLGDFNAYPSEGSMATLEGSELRNMMTYKDPITSKLLVSEDKHYTTNYNGNSQALDYIFMGIRGGLVNKRPEHEVLHINSNYMKRISDHDPLIAKFYFE